MRLLVNKSNRGSALVLAMLVTLALTAIGITAVNTVMETADRTGTYRIRNQTMALSEAATTYAGAKAARAPKAYIKMMEKIQKEEIGCTTKPEVKEEIKNRGPYVRFQSDGADSGTCGSLDLQYAENEENTGKTDILSFSSSSFTGTDWETFEANQPSRIETIVRDPVTVNAPGFGEEYCFKSVIIASEATLGDCTSGADCTDFISDDFSAGASVARQQTYMGALLGPIKCP